MRRVAEVPRWGKRLQRESAAGATQYVISNAPLLASACAAEGTGRRSGVRPRAVGGAKELALPRMRPNTPSTSPAIEQTRPRIA